MSLQEKEHDPNYEKMMQEATFDISILYIEEISVYNISQNLSEDRDTEWNEASRKFPVFSEKIMELRSAIKSGYKTESGCRKAEIAQREMAFNVTDVLAINLLTRILFARTADSSGNLDESLDYKREAGEMIQETLSILPFKKEPRTIKLEDVILAVLHGGLRLSKGGQSA